MNKHNDKKNCGCCEQNPPAGNEQAVDMNVCSENMNLLPMLQTYTTKVLKPHMHCCKNVLHQRMMNCTGHKYVIKWDFDLNGGSIIVPEDCILEFDGGSLKNGTIVGQDTLFINVGDVDIWGENLTREGTWREKQGGGGEQVQSDWNETNEESKAYIRNKPTIPTGGIPDKEYDPENHSGLGRKTLKLKDGSNILTQEDFDKSNTIYIIPYDFDLGGETVIIPEGCVLDFEGGSVSNGSLVSNNTVIYGSSDASNDTLYGVFYDVLGKYLSYNKKHTDKWDVGYQHGMFLSPGSIVNEDLMPQSICLTRDNVFVLCGTGAADGGTEPYYPIILVYDKYYNYIGKTRDEAARTHMNDVASDGQYMYVTGNNTIYKYDISKVLERAGNGQPYNDVETIAFDYDPSGLDYDAEKEEFCFACDNYIVVTDKNFTEKRKTTVNYYSVISDKLKLGFATTGIAYKNGVMMLSLWLCGFTDFSTDEGAQVIVTWDTVADKLVNLEYCKTGYNHGEVEGFYKDPTDDDNLYVLYYSSNFIRTVVIAKISQVNEVYGVNKKFGKAETLWAKNRNKRVIIDNNPKTPEQLEELGMRDGSSLKPFTSFESAYLLATGGVNRYEFEFINSATPYYIGKLQIEGGLMFQLRGNGGATIEGAVYVRDGKLSIYNLGFNAKTENVFMYNSCITVAQEGDLYLEELDINVQNNTFYGICAKHASRLALMNCNINGGSECVHAENSYLTITSGNFSSGTIGLWLQQIIVNMLGNTSIENCNTGIFTNGCRIAHTLGLLSFNTCEYAIDSEKTSWNINPDAMSLTNCGRFIKDHWTGYGVEFTVNNDNIAHLIEMLEVGANSASVLVHVLERVEGYDVGEYYWDGEGLVYIGAQSPEHEFDDFTDKDTTGLSQTSDFDNFRFLGLDGSSKYKFNRSVINEMSRQAKDSVHFTSNVDDIVRPGVYYGPLSAANPIFNDGPFPSLYHHVLMSGNNDVLQLVIRNNHNTIGFRNGEQSGYSTPLKPLRTPPQINTASGSTLTTYLNNLYRFDSPVSTLAITLPTPADSYNDRVILVLTTDSNPSITFSAGNNTIVYQTGYSITANSTYKITAEWIGNKWLVSYITIG